MSFTSSKCFKHRNWQVSMPSWAWVVTDMDSWTQWQKARFNALTGLSCYGYYSVNRCSNVVSMPSRAYTSFLPVLCQSDWGFTIARVNALSGLYLISTVPLQKPRFYAVSRACFCRYLSEYSDNSRFSCMLTFWTYLMRCTYPRHWIKYSTNYNRCHPIFFTLLISWAEQ